MLEKTSFPREKVCGDGLTPRAVREIQKLGLPHPETEGWRRNKGLRLIAGGRTIELPWPEVADFPQYGLIRTRLGFDEELARHAEAAGAVVLERHSVTEALRSEDGRVTGVRAALLDDPAARPAKRATSPPTSSSPRTATPPARRCPSASGNATTARSVSRSAPTSPARGTTTTGWKAGWSSVRRLPTPRKLGAGPAPALLAATASCCPATAGSSASATAPPMWAWAS